MRTPKPNGVESGTILPKWFREQDQAPPVSARYPDENG